MKTNAQLLKSPLLLRAIIGGLVGAATVLFSYACTAVLPGELGIVCAYPMMPALIPFIIIVQIAPSLSLQDGTTLTMTIIAALQILIFTLAGAIIGKTWKSGRVH